MTLSVGLGAGDGRVAGIPVGSTRCPASRIGFFIQGEEGRECSDEKTKEKRVMLDDGFMDDREHTLG